MKLSLPTSNSVFSHNFFLSHKILPYNFLFCIIHSYFIICHNSLFSSKILCSLIVFCSFPQSLDSHNFFSILQFYFLTQFSIPSHDYVSTWIYFPTKFSKLKIYLIKLSILCISAIQNVSLYQEAFHILFLVYNEFVQKGKAGNYFFYQEWTPISIKRGVQRCSSCTF